jgi:putative chitinase
MIKGFIEFIHGINESEIIDISDESTFPTKPQRNNEYFVIHHTAGLGDASHVVDVLNKRRLSVQWIVDIDGKIHRSLPANSIAYHAGGANLVPKVTNNNSQGVEVVGKDDADIKQRFDRDIEQYGYPRQAEAVRKIIKYLGYPKENVYGHGEITTNKARTEGSTIKQYVLDNWDKPVDLSGFRGPDKKASAGQIGSDSESDIIIDSDLVNRLINALKSKNFSQNDLKKFVSSNLGSSRIIAGSGKISETNLKLLYDAMDKYGITNKFAREAILGVISKESASAKSEISYANTSNGRIRTVFGSRVSGMSDSELDKLKANPERFFNKVYANIIGNGDEASGDGYKYRGRGFNGITGKGNYESLQKLYKGGSIDIVKNPELLDRPDIAAEFAILYFVRSFDKRNKSINDYSNIEDAVRDFAQANHGWGRSIDDSEIGREGYAKALDYSKSRMTA